MNLRNILRQASLSLFGAAFAAGVAILFGYYPANKASQLEPIQALRYE